MFNTININGRYFLPKISVDWSYWQPTFLLGDETNSYYLNNKFTYNSIYWNNKYMNIVRMDM